MDARSATTVSQMPESRTTGLVSGIAHVGLTVPDLDAALRMWRDGLGFTVERTFELDDDVVRRTTGVDGARARVAVVALGHERVELLEYEPPSAASTPTSPAAHGAMHIALFVTDIDETIRVCTAHGWQPVGPPHELATGPRAGTQIIYLHGPAGGLIELTAPPTSNA